MFNFTAPEYPRKRVAVLAGSGGLLVGPVAAWCLLPIEYFRADVVMKRVFQLGQDSFMKELLAADILARLNTRTWSEWDEIRESPTIPRGEVVRGLEIWLVNVDLQHGNLRDPWDVLSARQLFRYDPGGVFDDSRLRAQHRWL